MNFNQIVDAVDSFVWGWVLIVLILGAGLLLTVRTRFVQVRHLGKALKYMVKNEEGGEGEVTSFGALCTALSATIGTGNIVGVATAIALGGPGALLWMLVAAFFGMATKYSEGLLAVKYRTVDENGHALGGPFYYIERGIRERFGGNWKWLGKLFALFGALAGLLGIGTITQVNGVTESAGRLFKGDALFTIGDKSITLAIVISGAVVTICAALVILGGIKRIAKVSEVIVPFMAIAYVVFALVIMFANVKALPAAVALVCKTAFSGTALGGAIVGWTVKIAMQKGIGRGIFSNEAGLGSAPIAAAAAQTKSPVRQGLVTMTGTFIDTIVICTMTGLSIVLTGAWNPEITGENLEGFAVTAWAWEHGLPHVPGAVTLTLLSVCLAFFAFTTILGWDYYAERCVEYLVGGHKKGVLWTYRILYILAVAVGPYLTVATVWNIADIFNGLMAFPNLVALALLSGVVANETKEYFKKKNHDLT
ncbi:MAG: sodium:alanine symporter family protein [Clostridia bacterium]|nr:sodium:alanine symporter family protein [Clostridia bacterium]